jgi:hypothetical protein
MTKEQFGESFVEAAWILTPHHLKKAMRKSGHSGYVAAQRILNGLRDLGKVEKVKNLYVLKACKSEGGDHALAMTDAIAEIYARFDGPVVYREHSIEEKGLRPDIMCFVRKFQDDKCLELVFILEVVRKEDPSYTTTKHNTWKHWPEATQYLSQLFATTVKRFHFITSEELNTFMEEACAG